MPASAVQVQLSVTGLALVEAGKQVAAGEGHAHVFVDRDPVQPGQAIPTDQTNIVHLGKAPFDSRTLHLADGRHTLSAQLADSSHIALGAPTAKVTFTVTSPRPSISLVAPAQGSTVAGQAVEVWLSIEALETVDAGVPVEAGQGHAHLYVDREPVRPGQKVPTDQPNIVHLGKAPYDSRTLSLSDGEHTLWAQLADSSHVALDLPTPKVTFTVAPGFRGRGTLDPPCAEVATGSADARLIFPVSGGLAQGSISSRCGFRTEGGACSWTSISYRRVLGTFDAGSAIMRGDVYSSTQQRLEAGDPAKCGSGSVTNEPAEKVSAKLSGSDLTGSMGLARLTIHSDPSVVLEPALLALPMPTSARAPASAPKRLGTPIAIWVVAAAGAVGSIALVSALAVRSRRSTVPVAPVPPRADGTPRCPSCGEPRRESAVFCFSCGHRY